MQHFDQAVFQLEAFVQQAAELAELIGEALSVLAITFLAVVIESQRNLGNVIDPRVDLFSQLQRFLVTKRLGLSDQLFTDLEMPG
ncbi:hypothetical protein D3C76_1776210 [compost metagenome]